MGGNLGKGNCDSTEIMRESVYTLNGLKTCFAQNLFSTEDVDNIFHKNPTISFSKCYLS